MRTPEEIKKDIKSVEVKYEFSNRHLSDLKSQAYNLQLNIDDAEMNNHMRVDELNRLKQELAESEKGNEIPPYGAPVRCWNDERPEYPRLMYSKGELFNNNGLNVFRSNLYCEEEESTFFKHWEVIK